MDLAGEIADRVLLLSGGRTLAQGPSAEVLTQDNIRQAFCIESRIEIDPAGRRRIVPVAPAR
jgi:iron complex transport system ATP-binding protein